MVKKLCYNCMQHTEVDLVKTLVKEKVNDCEVTYEQQQYFCHGCNEIIINNELEQGNYERMYHEYKVIKGMLTSEDIKYIRKDLYNLSVRTFAQLIGCSPATISRYENGAIQSKQHDQQLKLLKNPENMQRLFYDNFFDLDDSDRTKLEERLEFLLEVSRSAELLKGFERNTDLNRIDDILEIEVVEVSEVEKFFIYKGIESEELITPLKLQKLLYYSQGWSMAISDSYLFDKDFQAWQHGPVIPSIYHKYKGLGYNGIKLECNEDNLSLDSNHRELLNWIWDKYGKFEAKFLEKMTHNERPWKITRGELQEDEKCNEVIDKKYIKEYFTTLFSTLKLIEY